MIVALLLPRNGNLPVLTSKPASRACFSVRPMEPICGSQYVACGAALAVKRLHFLACHAADGDDALHGSGMRELRKPRDDIADGIKAGLVGFKKRVCVHETRARA